MAEERDQGPKKSATERADELLNRVGWTAGFFGSMIGTRISRVAAYAREEAEDLWAEAQSIRQQNRGDLGAVASEAADEASSKAEETKESVEESTTPDEDTRTETATAEAEPETEEAEPEEAEPEEEAESIKATDAARRRAEELGVDLQEVEGTGSGGQITVDDVKKKAEAESSQEDLS